MQEDRLCIITRNVKSLLNYNQDEVILHEMAHLKHMHHRKSFWEYLSVLLGKDAKQSQKESCLFLGKYAELFYFIMKK